jgi:hypothetical protein
MKYEYGAVMEWVEQGKTELSDKNTFQCHFCLLQTPQNCPGIEVGSPCERAGD